MKRYALLAAGLGLVVGTAAGCGDGPPTDASTEEFCEAYADARNPDALEDFDLGATAEEKAEVLVDALDEQADNLDQVGSPEGIPDDAREGFGVFIEQLAGVDEDDLAEAIENQDEDFDDISDSDKEKTDALEVYASGTCGGLEQ
ncbi:MAG: hypothetical protein WKF79_11760 [Nocardioides sp.]